MMWPARGEWSARAGDGSTEGTIFLTSSEAMLSHRYINAIG